MILRKFLCCLLLLTMMKTSGQYYQYAFKRELSGIKDMWHEVVLPAGIFSKISPDFSDIRIISVLKSRDTVEAPYILSVASGQIKNHEIEFRIINESRTNNGYYYIFETDGTTAVNELNLEFNQQNFNWNVSLQGSQDLQQWFTITDSSRILSIYNEQVKFAYTKLVLPPGKYIYYRLHVTSLSDPQLRKAGLSKKDTIAGKGITYPLSSLEIDNQKKTRQTILRVNLLQHVPVSSLEIFVHKNFDYVRPINIRYVSDSFITNDEWKYMYNNLSSGMLNSFENNRISFQSTILQKLEIIIENGDNELLTIDSVQVNGFLHVLRARFTTAGEYFLIYGNKSASLPQYELNSFNDKIPLSLTPLTVGDELVLHKDKTRSGGLFREKKWLWFVMIVIIGLLAVFTINMMKKMPGEG